MQVPNRSLYGGNAVTLKHLGQTLIGRARGRHLGQNVTLALPGATDVGQDQIEFFVISTRGGKYPQWWNTQPFLPGIPGFRDVTAGSCAANISPVGKADRERLQSPFGEYRPHCLDIREVVTAELR